MAGSNVRNVTTVVLIAAAAVALAFAFLRPTSEVTFQQGDVSGIDQATVFDPVVTSQTAEGGFRFLGITFSSPTHRVQVTFTAPPECADVIAAATRWPTGSNACGADGSVAGEIFGSGRTASGDTIVSVRFEVTEGCWNAVDIGEVWGTNAECR